MQATKPLGGFWSFLPPQFATGELLESIETRSIVGLRDRALIGVMVYTVGRVSVVIGMKVEDYYPQGKRWHFRL